MYQGEIHEFPLTITILVDANHINKFILNKCIDIATSSSTSTKLLRRHALEESPKQENSGLVVHRHDITRSESLTQIMQRTISIVNQTAA
jgi:hypothetical protein